MIIIYKILINTFFFIVFLLSPIVCLISKKRRANLYHRFGIATFLKKTATNKQRIWIHALSVGEVNSTIPLVRTLKKKHFDIEIIFTTTTKTGFDLAKKRLYSGKEKLVDQVGYFPFDNSFSIKKISKLIRADAIVIVETDLWPNFLNEMEKLNIPVILINARMSKKSLAGYLKFNTFSSQFFSKLSQIMVQSSYDEERFTQLKIDRKKIKVVGNLKFDQPKSDLDANQIIKIKKELGISRAKQVLLAGSTHDGEEKVLLNAYKKLKFFNNNLSLIIAPRDPNRHTTLLELCETRGFRTCLYSERKEEVNDHSEIILVDQMGVLSTLYSICDVAFIGGSITKNGGHNPLEAAAFSKPILFGSDMSDFITISQLLVKNKGAIQVDSENELETAFQTILDNSLLQKQMGENGNRVYSQHSGAMDKIILNLEQMKIV